MNDKAVYRTSPATPGLLKIKRRTKFKAVRESHPGKLAKAPSRRNAVIRGRRAYGRGPSPEVTGRETNKVPECRGPGNPSVRVMEQDVDKVVEPWSLGVRLAA